MMHRLNVEELSVETFDPSATPQVPNVDPNDPYQRVEWTGCLSDCTECGHGGDGLTLFNNQILG